MEPYSLEQQKLCHGRHCVIYKTWYNVIAFKFSSGLLKLKQTKQQLNNVKLCGFFVNVCFVNEKSMYCFLSTWKMCKKHCLIT